MDRTPTSFPPSPSVRSPSTDHSMMEVSSVYSSPSNAHPNYVADPRLSIGLGISTCGFPASGISCTSYPSPASDWSGRFFPSQRLLDPTLDPGHFPSVPNYERIYSRPDVSVSPLSPYPTQARSHGSPMEFGQRHGITNCYDSSFWANTPRSNATTCGDFQYKIKKEDIDKGWEQALIEPSHTASAPLPMQMPQPAITMTTMDTQQWNDEGSSPANFGLIPDENYRGDAKEEGDQSEVIMKWVKDQDKPSNKKRRKVPSASGLQCTICGVRFTRRSNCQEHMKRHDPSRRKSYTCEHCERPFGRRTDLRRHIDSIHHGIRKFVCDLCGQRFSRQDTLTRHIALGCRRSCRRAGVYHEGGGETGAPEWDAASQGAYFEGQLQNFRSEN